jgi:adenylate cyclase
MDKSPIIRFYRELKRRKVIRVAVAYAVVAWIVVEIASVMFPELLLPDWSVRLVIALLVIGFPIALVLAWAFELKPDGIQVDTGHPEEDPGEPDSQGEQARSPHQEGFHSVAVLPFLNLSNDPDNEYFSDGISEELLNLLCKLPQLTVASRTSSFSFKGKDVDMGTVASRLRVDAILEGSVRRSGDRVRISAQLIDGRSDRHLWSEHYDRELTDVFAVQDEIEKNIVDALELSLTPAQRQLIERKEITTNIDAYDFYLRGRYYVERGDVDIGQKMFENAIGVDEAYALAWAGVADCHSWRCMLYEVSPESKKLADEYSLKALQLAPGLAEAHASRGYALTANGRYTEAETEFKTALDLDPQLYEAYYYSGRAYYVQGKFREAADAFGQANAVRPDDPTSASLRCTALKTLGRESELAVAHEQCVAIFERHLSLNPDDALAWSRIAVEMVMFGEREKGLEYANRAYELSPEFCRYNVACAHVLAGEHDRALELLAEHASKGAVQKDWLARDSDWDAVRNDPRFKAIEEKVS